MNREERRKAAKQGRNPDPATITWASNSVWAPTGYGTQSSQVVRRLIKDGHHVAVASNYGLMAMQTVYEDIPHYPMGTEAYSNDVIESYHADWSRQHKDGTPLVIVLYDAWPLKGPQWDRMPTAIWTMIDHVPVPPAVHSFLAKDSVTPIAASRFGEEQIHRSGLDCLYVPMAIDTSLYAPTASWSNGQVTKTGTELMGWDDDGGDWFTVSMVNANKGVVPSRKAWAENLLAFSIFASKHDDARLYLHTERFGNQGGIALDPIIRAVGLEDHQYKFVNQFAYHMGIPNEAVAAVYTASDVLLASTLAEGFGLTVLEAQATGTPVIVNNFSAQPELVGEGWLTEGQPWWDPLQFAWFNTPNVPSIVDCLEQAYARGKGRSDKARAKAMEYDADDVFRDYWRPVISTLIDKHRASE